MLEQIVACGVEIAHVTLHVGLGTFAPLRVERVDEVRLHRERYSISPETADAVNRARREQRRIVAVGTTVVRTLEAAAKQAGSGLLAAHSADTNIIAPGFEFQLVGALLTNFHLPQSSLLMLVSAFAGRENVLLAYRYAVVAVTDFSATATACSSRKRIQMYARTATGTVFPRCRLPEPRKTHPTKYDRLTRYSRSGPKHEKRLIKRAIPRQAVR